MLLTVAVFALLASLAQIPPITAITVGVALAMSSTAIVSRLLIEQGELKSSYGRNAICMLLFQDLATIVFLVVCLSGCLRKATRVSSLPSSSVVSSAPKKP